MTTLVSMAISCQQTLRHYRHSHKQSASKFRHYILCLHTKNAVSYFTCIKTVECNVKPCCVGVVAFWCTEADGLHIKKLKVVLRFKPDKNMSALGTYTPPHNPKPNLNQDL